MPISVIKRPAYGVLCRTHEQAQLLDPNPFLQQSYCIRWLGTVSPNTPCPTDLIDDEVLGLEIPVRDALLVHVAQGIDNHSAVELDVVWGQT